MAASQRASKGFKVAEASSILTTSPIWIRSPTSTLTQPPNLRKAQQPRHAIVRHRHLGDDAAHARGLQIAQAPGNSSLEALERGNRRRVDSGIDHEADPSVLMASCSDPSDWEASAATPSNERVTSIRRVISRTGSTFELSTAP